MKEAAKCKVFPLYLGDRSASGMHLSKMIAAEVQIAMAPRAGEQAGSVW